MPARPNRPREYTQEQRQEALKLVKKLGLSAAARQLGYPLQTVSFWKNGRKPKGAAQPGTADVAPAPSPVKAAEVEPNKPPAHSSVAKAITAKKTPDSGVTVSDAPEAAAASSKSNVAKSYKP